MENKIKQKLDVIIPYYNKKDYIDDAVDSVFNQTNIDLLNKVIIVNDGSDSENTKYLKHFMRYPKVQVVNRRTNRGLFYTRLEGFRVSTADYVVSLDADDEFTADAFNTFSDWIKQNKTDVTLIYEMISSYEGKLDDDRRHDMEDFWSFSGMIAEHAHFDNSFCIKMLTRRTKDKLVDLLDSCHLPPEIKLNFMEDVLFTGILMSCEDNFAYVDRIAYKYNRNCDGIMSGVRDITPFEVYYQYIKPTNRLTPYTIQYLDYQMKRAKGE